MCKRVRRWWGNVPRGSYGPRRWQRGEQRGWGSEAWWCDVCVGGEGGGGGWNWVEKKSKRRSRRFPVVLSEGSFARRKNYGPGRGKQCEQGRGAHKQITDRRHKCNAIVILLKLRLYRFPCRRKKNPRLGDNEENRLHKSYSLAIQASLATLAASYWTAQALKSWKARCGDNIASKENVGPLS